MYCIGARQERSVHRVHWSAVNFVKRTVARKMGRILTALQGLWKTIERVVVNKGHRRRPPR